MKQWLYVVAAIIFAFALFAYDGQAATFENSVDVVFNSAALERGYTVKSTDDFFWLPIFAKQVSAEDLDGAKLKVKIGKVDDAQTLPVGVTRISSVYSYEIDGASIESKLLKPVLLSLKYFSDNDLADKAIYLLGDGDWRELDTKILEKNDLAQAWSCAAGGLIVVVEKNDADLTARAAIVIDDATGDVLFSKNMDVMQSIASLTKIVTALVFLDNNPGWNKIVEISEADNVGGASLSVKSGDRLTVRDLFFATLIGSKNNAAMALARSTGFEKETFVEKMNRKALDLGAKNTFFVEPTGLDDRNVSTAGDLAKIMRQAFRSQKMLEGTTLKSYSVKILNKNKTYSVTNTNKLLSTDLYITGGKTGHTDEAGYCLGTKARLNGRDVLAVVLGAEPEKNYKEVYYLLKKFAS